MFEKLNTALARLTQARRQNEIAIAKDANEMFVAMARAKADGKEQDLPDHVVEHWGALIEMEHITPADIELNLRRALDRIQQAEQATQEAELLAEADRLHAAAHQFDLESAAQHRRNMETLRHMQQDADAKTREYTAAVSAKSELQATAFVTEDEKEVEAESQRLISEIRRLKNKLDTNYRPQDGLSAMLHVNPAALVKQTEHNLAVAKASPIVNSERVADFKGLLSKARAEVADIEKQLAGTEKKLAAVSKRLLTFAEAKLFPESFQIVRSTPSLDVSMKALARERGYAAIN
jgi:hypothetical protein